jgi:hypothetical protein
MLTVADQTVRKHRLERLAQNLTRETYVIGEADDPLLYLERKAYIAALRDAVAGLEIARVTLAKALHRIAQANG